MRRSATPGSDRADHVGERRCEAIDADARTPARAQRAHQRFAEVTGRTRDEDAHGLQLMIVGGNVSEQPTPMYGESQ
jgi:hypothetical protein